MANDSLSNAKNKKNDEFHTVYDYIQREMNAYLEYDPDVFRGNLMQPAERLCTYFQLPPIRFSRNGLRNQFEQKVEYRVRVGVEV